MKILMISSEAVPFAKSGGLGDAVSALSVALFRLGHDVRVLIPRYGFIAKEKLTPLAEPISVVLGGAERKATFTGNVCPYMAVPCA